MRYRHRTLALLILIFFAATLSRAQDNYEIQVYGSDLVDPRYAMVQLQSNFTIDGSKTIVDGVYPTNPAEHETVEIAYGFNDWFEWRLQYFTSITEGLRGRWVGGHIRPRVAVPKEWRWPVGVDLSTSAIRGGNIRWMRGHGRFVRLSIKRSADGIGA